MSWGVRYWLKVTLGIWTLVFVIGVVPIAMLHNWKLGTLTVVEGRLSGHHVVKIQRKSGVELAVRATLEFDGPLGQCRHDEVGIGPYKPESFATNVQLAVRTDSCGGYFFLPSRAPSVLGWVAVYLSFSIFLIFFVWLMHSVAARQSPPQPPPKRSVGST